MTGDDIVRGLEAEGCAAIPNREALDALRAEVDEGRRQLALANAALAEMRERDRRQVAEVERLRAGQSLMLDDLAALLRAVGLGDHARPETPHFVMLSAIAEVERLRGENQALRENYERRRDEHEQAEARLADALDALRSVEVSSGVPDYVRRNVRAALAAVQPEECDCFPLSSTRGHDPSNPECGANKAAAQPEEPKP